MEDIKLLLKEENQSTSSSKVLNGDDQALNRNLKMRKVVPQTYPEIDSQTLSESDRILMSLLSCVFPFSRVQLTAHVGLSLSDKPLTFTISHLQSVGKHASIKMQVQWMV